MRLSSLIRYAPAAFAFCGLALFAFERASTPAEGQSNFIQDGEAGFVVSDISFVFSGDASETGACPQGLSQNALANLFGREAEPEQQQRFREMLADAELNPCLNPQSAGPDPDFRTVAGHSAPLTGGIDLDGQDSRANGRAAPGTCAHEDFRAANGSRGIDNQFFRVMGCTNGYQPGGQANGFAIEMLTGAWGILIALEGVDDLRNDDEVQVGIYANADPIQLSPAREPVASATYAAIQDPRFRATARGRIVDGVLSTDPVDVRFPSITNGLYLERPLRDARLRMNVGSDGALEGILAGYAPVEELYDFTFGYRDGATAAGELAPVRARAITGLGRAATLGYSCNGVYHALLENADGHPDPATGRCTSISTQYHIRAIPAFVIEAETSSANDDLEQSRSDGAPSY